MFQFSHKATARLVPSELLLFKTLVKSCLHSNAVRCYDNLWFPAFCILFNIPPFITVLIILFLQFKDIYSSNISVFI